MRLVPNLHNWFRTALWIESINCGIVRTGTMADRIHCSLTRGPWAAIRRDFRMERHQGTSGWNRERASSIQTNGLMPVTCTSANTAATLLEHSFQSIHTCPALSIQYDKLNFPLYFELILINLTRNCCGDASFKLLISRNVMLRRTIFHGSILTKVLMPRNTHWIEASDIVFLRDCADSLFLK